MMAELTGKHPALPVQVKMGSFSPPHQCYLNGQGCRSARRRTFERKKSDKSKLIRRRDQLLFETGYQGQSFTACVILLLSQPTSSLVPPPPSSFHIAKHKNSAANCLAFTACTSSSRLGGRKHGAAKIRAQSTLYFNKNSSESNSVERNSIEYPQPQIFDWSNRRAANFDRQMYTRKRETSETNRARSRTPSLRSDEWDSDAGTDTNFLGGSPFDDYLSDSSLGDAPWDKDDYEIEISKGEVEQTINSTSESTEMSFPDQPNLELVALHQHSSDGINVSDSTFNYTNATIEPSISERKQPANPTNSTNTIQTRISKDQLQDIKSSISIIDVIESYNLPNFVRTNSYTAKACCPFHDDHNPSMSIDENRGIYKCFACGAGGDLFNFIREYDALSGSKEKMGFMEAVQYAVKEFGGERVRGMDNFDTHQIRRWDENMSEEAKAKMVEREKKKESIRHLNNVAAAFYTKCLVTLPTAGKARAHLRTRQLTADSIRSFALGYAPDCYFGDEATAKKKWGEGSLVEYLAGLGFSSSDMIEAGVAVRPNSKATHSKDEEEDEDHSELMDRFRSRLVVPIVDKSGKNVIGFGGRHLENVRESNDSSFTPAKYINSPESPVFTKKFVLFNEHNARVAIEEDLTEMKSSEGADRNNANAIKAARKHLPVIIVEGYFDAIALSNVGVKNVVASMGTALTVEQLKSAAAMADSSQIILCLDNDDAGRTAVERICNNNIIPNTPELLTKDIFVATLPNGIKDPADFVGIADKDEEATSRFETEVIQQAQPWDEWYLTQIIKKNGGASADGSSLPAIVDDVSSFLAAFPDAADRTQKARSAAEVLADRFAKDFDSKSSIGMKQVQIESDISNMISRKNAARETLERRTEQTSLDHIATMNIIDESKLSTSALAKLHPTRQGTLAEVPRWVHPQRRASRKPPLRTSYKRRSQSREKDMVPHFNGLNFKHKTDRDWLGLNNRSKHNMILGVASSGNEDKHKQVKAETSLFDEPNKRSQRENDLVYFNSNQYHGERYLTAEAMDAGYQLTHQDRPLQDESLVEFTDRMVLERNAGNMILQAEDRLLHALAKFPQARNVMKTVYTPSTFTQPNMKWTSEERQWLFECLAGFSDPPLPDELLDGGNAIQLRSQLAIRQDCPPGAFVPEPIHSSMSFDTSNAYSEAALEGDSHFDQMLSNGADEMNTNLSSADALDGCTELDSLPAVEENVSAQHIAGDKGPLDEYFLDASDLFPSFGNTKIEKETRAELTVQETVATLLRASSINRFSSVKSKLAKIVLEMDRRADADSEQERQSFFDEEFTDTSREDLQEMFEHVAMEAMEAQMALYESDRSTDRVNAHLLDYSTTNSVQYKLSQAEGERLERMMNDHISSLPDDHHRPDTPGDDGSYVFGSDQDSDEIDARYGGRDPDDYVVRGLPNGESKWA